MFAQAKRVEYPWGAMTWLAEGRALGVSLAKMTIKPQKTPPAHFHNNCEEIIHVETGEISLRRGGEWIKMRAGDTIAMLKGVVHQISNPGEGEAVLTICYTSGERHYEEASD